MFMSKLSAVHTTTSDWAANYLTKEEYRIQNMLEPVLYEDSKNLYNLAYRKYKDRLMFRSKTVIVADNKLELINIWDSAETHDAFVAEVKRDDYLAAFESVGLNASYEFAELTTEQAAAVIQSVVDQPQRIIQELKPVFGIAVENVGDPLKVPASE